MTQGMLFDLGEPVAQAKTRSRPRYRLPVTTDAEQLVSPLVEDDPAAAMRREELYRHRQCPVDPSVTPCPMAGCTHHVMTVDPSRSVAELLAELESLPYTCLLSVTGAHPQGMSVDELVPVLRLQPQTIRDIEKSALLNPAFDPIVEQVEDWIDDELSDSQRVRVLREVLSI